MSRRPQLTIRARLTLLYGAMFLLAGSLLLLLTFALVQQTLGVEIAQVPIRAGTPGTSVEPAAAPRPPSPAEQQLLDDARAQFRRVALTQIALQGGVALAVTGLLSFGLGWLLAGRVLRPLHLITAQARDLSESSLHQRLRLPGPRDELKDLADTLDGMLDRLERAFLAHRHFIGNASHELRTPIAIARTAVDVLEAKPEPTRAQVTAAVQTVQEATRRSENLIDGLLTLTRSQHLADQRKMPLDAVVRRVVGDNVPADRPGLPAVHCSLAPVVVLGDETLLTALVNNLVQNALRYNQPDGSVDVRLTEGERTAVLTVVNTGPVVPSDDVPHLVEPFRRAGTPRTGAATGGAGLGLSIVQAVTAAHGGSLEVRARAAGGLEVEVRLPVPDGGPDAQQQSGLPAVKEGGRGSVQQSHDADVGAHRATADGRQE